MIQPENLLIIRTDRIGDVVLTLPAAGIIKKHYPKCRISFLVKEYTAPLLRGSRSIDNILVLPESNGKLNIFEAYKLLRKYQFDSVIIVYPTFQLAFLTFFAGIKERIGTGYRWYSFLFNERVYEHRKYAEKHELEYNISLLNKLNIDENVSKSNISYELAINKESELKIEQILLDHIKDLSLPIMIVHPGSSGSSVDLPLNKMKELIITAQKLNINILLTGSKSEAGLCDHLASGTDAINFAGMLHLEELTALISKTSVLVANSTGPLHIASALGKNVIGFYPRVKACSPERWGPYTDKGIVFQPKIDCKDCTIEQCKRLNCMNSIDMNDVFNEIKKIIKGK